MLQTDVAAESGISVVADGVAVVSNLQLSSSQNTGYFSIGARQINTNSFVGVISHIEAFNTITITKASGATSGIIYYATEQGF
jgi:hypothetical protein